MSETGKIKFFTVWGLGLLIGLLAIRSVVAANEPPYNVIPYKYNRAISKVIISADTKEDTGLITTFIVRAGTVSGQVDCGPRNLPPGAAYHFTMIDLPRESNGRFRINDNLSMSASAKDGTAVNTWSDDIYSAVCSNKGLYQYESAQALANAYPITLYFYVKHRPIDNLITFPSMPLGGYIRAFGAQIGSREKVYAIPIVLTGGTISLDTACTVSPQSLTINHGTVPRGLVSHRMAAPITYACKTPVKATFTLSYEADRNGALPLKDSLGGVGAVSKLTITDPQTGASGRSIHAEIQTAKTFTVSSELSQITGSGLVSGSAWLIATHD
ncbi:Uncharacterised protein [Pragia fontium]|uniref:Adhesin n=1 Tax=Pragia fontium DSM 5563 = ATCC 49100 TaxID=1122977 RepID=A0AAJ5BFU5_9GAMM|nr:hypothetical protein [Pragia fontium]SFC05138.1 hypothetical protein SAMN02745723_101259 [Pragia fontium DSM 5563 = ATCC 49100]SUB81547.1 Uncharacterised protein [Pragia fontium]